MSLLRSSRRAFAAMLFSTTTIAAATAFSTSPAFAQEDRGAEAAAHFKRAVALYSEADYKAALVEFKRAYELQPHVTVLYNLGQTYYQLQNYAEALTTFERFLAEGGTAHRNEVENAVSVLKTRVGRVDVTTPTPGWEISVDDEPVGKTPLPKPIPVSIGKRRISATKAGETTQSRVIEVAAGETQPLTLGGAGGPAPTPGQPQKTETTLSTDDATKGDSGKTLLILGWAGTAALATGAVVTGILASSAASDLEDARGRPATKGDLEDKASSTTTLAVVTDVLAASAIVLGGVSLYFTLTRSSSTTGAARSPSQQAKSGLRLGGGPGRFVLGGTF